MEPMPWIGQQLDHPVLQTYPVVRATVGRCEKRFERLRKANGERLPLDQFALSFPEDHRGRRYVLEDAVNRAMVGFIEQCDTTGSDVPIDSYACMICAGDLRIESPSYSTPQARVHEFYLNGAYLGNCQGELGGARWSLNNRDGNIATVALDAEHRRVVISREGACVASVDMAMANGLAEFLWTLIGLASLGMIKRRRNNNPLIRLTDPAQPAEAESLYLAFAMVLRVEYLLDDFRSSGG